VTFSIVARSSDDHSLGVAVASKFLAVGAYVPAAEAGNGAIATQSFANLAYRVSGLALLRSGSTAQQTLDALVDPDDRREERQVGIVGSSGPGATFTGRECNPWAGGKVGDGYAIQGNILTGPEVVSEMERAWLASAEEPDLARRLLAALKAGDAAGGDRRGRQSAAVFVVSPGSGYGGGNDVLADLRVDDHANPVLELERLADLRDLYFGSTPREQYEPLEGPLLAEVADILARVGHPPTGSDPVAVRDALWNWAGVENLEERVCSDPAIDPVVLRELRSHAAASQETRTLGSKNA
jgi:uncharacterized Ntn-hydrolase superfamily protein